MSAFTSFTAAPSALRVAGRVRRNARRAPVAVRAVQSKPASESVKLAEQFGFTGVEVCAPPRHNAWGSARRLCVPSTAQKVCGHGPRNHTRGSGADAALQSKRDQSSAFFLRMLLKAARCGYYRPFWGAHERQLLTDRERGSLVIYALFTTQEGLFGFRPFPELWVGRLASACPGECALRAPCALCESHSLTRRLTHHNYHL